MVDQQMQLNVQSSINDVYIKQMWPFVYFSMSDYGGRHFVNQIE